MCRASRARNQTDCGKYCLRFEQSLQAVGQAGAFVHNAEAMKDQWLDGAHGAVLRRPDRPVVRCSCRLTWLPSPLNNGSAAASETGWTLGRHDSGLLLSVWSGSLGSLALDTKVLDNCLGSAADVKLLENVLQVVTNGPGADIRFVRDLFV